MHAYARYTHTHTNRSHVLARARVCARVYVCARERAPIRTLSAGRQRERGTEVSENYTLLLFSTLYKSLPSKHLRASFHPCFQRATVRSPNRRSRRSRPSTKGSTESVLEEWRRRASVSLPNRSLWCIYILHIQDPRMHGYTGYTERVRPCCVFFLHYLNSDVWKTEGVVPGTVTPRLSRAAIVSW